MGKRRVGALEKVDADLSVLKDDFGLKKEKLTQTCSPNLQYKIRRDPMYVFNQYEDIKDQKF